MKDNLVKKDYKFNNIAIMTSGGDSPGMNMVVVSLLKLLYHSNMQAYIVYDGIKGLLDNNIKKFDYNNFYEFSDSIFLSGTIIRSSRVPEFKLESNVNKAVKNLNSNDIDILIVIGGDGSIRAAKDLKEKGIKVICIPATIDNDVSYSDYTIGYSSALNLILNSIFAIRNTAKSFNSFCLIEVMGRECSDLSVNISLATFADGTITKDNPWTVEDFCNKINLIRSNNKNWGLFIVTEKFYGQNGVVSYAKLVKEVEEKTHIHMKFNSIGYTQRGASPTADELVKAFEISKYCVEKIIAGDYNILLGWKNDKNLVNYDFETAFSFSKSNNKDKLDLINKLAEIDFFNKNGK